MSGSRFQFNAPQAAALDPSQLEALYAGSAARQLGPGMNLGLSLVEGANERSRQQQYLEELAKVNSMAMNAGVRSLAHDAAMERLKQGIGLVSSPNGREFVGTPLAIDALSQGSGQYSLDPRMLQAIYERGARMGEANIFETAGKGANQFAAGGLYPNAPQTSELVGIDLAPGTPSGVAASAASRPVNPEFMFEANSKGDVTYRGTKNAATPENVERLFNLGQEIKNRAVQGGGVPKGQPAPADKLPTEYTTSLQQYIATNPGASFTGRTYQDGKGRRIVVVNDPKRGQRHIELAPQVQAGQ